MIEATGDERMIDVSKMTLVYCERFPEERFGLRHLLHTDHHVPLKSKPMGPGAMIFAENSLFKFHVILKTLILVLKEFIRLVVSSVLDQRVQFFECTFCSAHTRLILGGEL